MTDYRTKTQEITAKIQALRERVNQAEGNDKLELEAEITELMKKINQLLDESLKARIK